MPQTQNQKIRCAHAQVFLWSVASKECRWNLFFFLRIIWFGQNMENYVIHKKFCVLKFPKVREKVYYNRWIGGWTKSKNEYSCLVGHPTMQSEIETCLDLQDKEDLRAE